MDPAFKDVASQVPNLVALGGIVWMFLKHSATQAAEHRAFVQTLHGQTLETQKRAEEVIEQNTEALGRVAQALQRL